jgi:predicted amidohydrolase YtcJ
MLRDAEVGGTHVDIKVEQARVVALGPPGSLGGMGTEIDCVGGAVVPGLHDHHLHLMAMAAALVSIDVSHHLDDGIRAAYGMTERGSWLRAVGYSEAESGALDRWRLDELSPDVPVRIQHRSGAMWVLNTMALGQVGAFTAGTPGIERNGEGEPTGRLFGLDAWLGDRLSTAAPPDLSSVGRRLASHGVTGVTDCTPASSTEYAGALARAVQSGELPLTVMVTGGLELSEHTPPADVRRGPVKIVIADHELPALADLVGWFRRAHQVPRPVAVHCVTRAALVLALSAWEEAGSMPGDRVEHASVTPPELIPSLTELGIAVVTQPAFITARGDEYLHRVEPQDRDDLYRCASLLRAGVSVGGSTDAPFGPDDPWIAIRAATERRSQRGERVGDDAGLAPSAALNLFLAPLESPGGRPRTVEVGAPADLCLLDAPIHHILKDPQSRHVATTIAGGQVTFSA